MLKDAINPLPNKSLCLFIDWKRVEDNDSFKDSFGEKLMSAKGQLYGLEILILILATGDIFQKPDNYS